MYYLQNIKQVMTDLKTSDIGLSAKEADDRLKKNGLNKLKEPKKTSSIVKFLKQFADYMIIFLLSAAIISGVIGIVTKSGSELLDSGIILLIVLVNAIIGFVQENKAEKAMDSLKELTLPFASVLREGSIVQIRTTDLVVGDIVLIEAGDIIPADLRIMESVNLKISEATLTGESEAVTKISDTLSGHLALADRRNMAYSTGVVEYGRGKGVVVNTGMNTEVGKIAGLISGAKQEQTGLQKKLNKTGKIITFVCLGCSLLIFIMALITNMGILSAFMTAIAIAVAAIPEGLPAVITIIMAIGVQKLSKRKAIIKRLTAVETLGSTEIICSDKTGTLTINKMRVMEEFTLKEGDKKALLTSMVLCNNARLNAEINGVTVVGDPTETALLEYAFSKGIRKDIYENSYKRIQEKPFDSNRKRMSVVNIIDAEKVVNVKGAPDEILKECTHIFDGGVRRPINLLDKQKILLKIKDFGEKALRMLGFASKVFNGEELENNLTFIGIIGMMDPPRKETKMAIERCREAGIKVVMITGDHKTTAMAIARQIGMDCVEKSVLTGFELDKLKDEEFIHIIETINVFARVSPENKVRIVKTLKKLGRTVAMTGDGVNDAPSLKEANIGIGMGINGTEVTRQVADMVLSDDNFSTIVTSVEEGRKIYSNIIKTIQFLLSANVAEMLSLLIITLFFAPFFGGIVFLVPVQILFVNLVTDSLPALALGVEPAERDIMKKPPRKDSSNLLSGRVGFNIMYQALIQTAIVLSIFLIGTFNYSNIVGSTMALITLNFIQLFHSFNMRSESLSIVHMRSKKNKFLSISFVVGGLLTILICTVPFLMVAFQTTKLNPFQWILSVGGAFLIIPSVEAIKYIQRHKAVAKKRQP